MTDGPKADRRAQIADYLLAQGEKNSWLELWPRVMSGRLELLDAIFNVDAAQADFKPSPDVWSISEVLRHALDSSRGVARTVERLAQAEPAADAPDFDLTEASTESWTDLRSAFMQDSVSFANLITRLPEPPSLDATADHMFFGPLHARAWFLFQRIHDKDHQGQIVALKQTPGFPTAS